MTKKCRIIACLVLMASTSLVVFSLNSEANNNGASLFEEMNTVEMTSLKGGTIYCNKCYDFNPGSFSLADRECTYCGHMYRGGENLACCKGTGANQQAPRDDPSFTRWRLWETTGSQPTECYWMCTGVFDLKCPKGDFWVGDGCVATVPTDIYAYSKVCSGEGSSCYGTAITP